MITALFATSFALIAIFAGMHGYQRAASEKPSRGGWYGLAGIALLSFGLWLAGKVGNESLAYGFGITLMLVLPAMLLAGVAGAIGSALGRRGNRNRQG